MSFKGLSLRAKMFLSDVYNHKLIYLFDIHVYILLFGFIHFRLCER